MSPVVDFDAINALAMAKLPALLARWFPNGHIEHTEFCVGNLRGESVFRFPQLPTTFNHTG